MEEYAVKLALSMGIKKSTIRKVVAVLLNEVDNNGDLIPQLEVFSLFAIYLSCVLRMVLPIYLSFSKGISMEG